jgi:predicted N-formylglutamate amidohydrolase
MARGDRYLVTCEHGGNRIPPRYHGLFAGFEAVLQSHRGHDPGALTLARELAQSFDAALFVSTTSRLLVDLNRSLGHPRLYSEATRGESAAVRRAILQAYYLPYRDRVEAHVRDAVAGGARVVHVASHSFTPQLDGVVRNADVGLLYDPTRPGEVEACRRWQAAITACAPGLTVRRNYPYTGRSDGFTAYLRRRFPPEAYLGIELEINQKHVFRGGRHWRALRGVVVAALREAMACL